MYPLPHVGWQIVPLVRELVHVPTAPFSGGADASQGPPEVSRQSIMESTPPRTQVRGPDGLKPLEQVGWQESPICNEPLQSPTAPFSGATEASHVDGSHASGGPS